jgi:glutamate:GABA antiporter
MKKKPARVLGLFTLVMINVAAIGGVKNWPVTAEYGLSSVVYLILAAVIFFIPVSLAAAELASAWPKDGGVFTWVKEAFGHRMGFLAIWLQWVENIAWYPTALSFIAATVAYIFNPQLIHNVTYLVTFILIVFWISTFANLLGMRASGLISSLGTVFGIFIPGAFIIILGILWLVQGHPLQIEFSAANLIPEFGNVDQFVFFTGVILSLAGMEMSAVHVRNVENPQKKFPQAIFASILVILGLSALGVLAIAMVIPQKEISLVSGGLQAFSIFVKAYNLDWLTPYMAALIAIGAFGSLSTWTIGPCRGLLTAAQTGDLPPLLRRINRKEMPVSLLILQAIIVSLLSLAFLLMPTVNSGYWILTALVAELYLIMYLLMFAAVIRLRYKKPNVVRPYKIPGGMVGIWILGILGFLSSLFAIVIGFFPPAQITTGNVTIYVTSLLAGVVIFCVAPSIILLFQKPSWKEALEHEGK